MVKLIFLLLVSASSFAQRPLVNAPPANYNALIENGTFAPATSLNSKTQKYRDFKYGWLIGYTMSTFYGHWAAQLTADPPDPSYFNVKNVNVDQWVTEAVARNLDYAALTLFTEYGFLIYESEVQYNMPQITLSNGATSPYYTDPYCIEGQADKTLVRKFVDKFKAAGIEPVAYVGVGGNSNLTRYTLFESFVPPERQELIVQYYCKVIQEIVRKFGFKYLWFDMAAPYMAGGFQRMYNAAKSIDPDITIIGNTVGETDFARQPYDIQSTEEYPILLGGNTAYRTTQRPLGVGPYYIPQEIVATPYGINSQWFDYDAACPVQPVVNPIDGVTPYVKLEWQPAEDYQSLIDEAEIYGTPFFAAMLVKRNGTLQQDNLNFLDQFDFSNTGGGASINRKKKSNLANRAMPSVIEMRNGKLVALR